MNADVLNELYQIDVFGPALLSLGTVTKTFIIDLQKIGQTPEFDVKMKQVFSCSPAIFAAFGVPTLINYFQQFYQNNEFYSFIPRIIDARIMYHKV